MRIALLGCILLFGIQQLAFAGAVPAVVQQRMKAMEVCKTWQNQGSCQPANYPNQGILQIAQVTCQNTLQAMKCDQLKDKLSANDQKKMKKCTMPDLCDQLQQAPNLSDCWEGLKKFGKDSADKAVKAIGDATNESAKLQSCNSDLTEKKQFFADFNDSVSTVPSLQIPALPDSALNTMSCLDIKRHIEGTYQNLLQKQLRTLRAFDSSHPTAKNQPSQYPPDLKAFKDWMDENGREMQQKIEKLVNMPAAIAKFLNDADIKYNCYTTAVQTQLFCYAAATMAASALSGAAGAKALAYAGKLAAIAGDMTANASVRVLNAVDDAVHPGRLANLKNDSNEMRTMTRTEKDAAMQDAAPAHPESDSSRVAAAKDVVGRDLTSTEKKAVIEAHNVGYDQGRGYYSYTPDDLKKKIQILQDAGFKKEEIDILMRKGITGLTKAEQQGLKEYEGLLEKAKKDPTFSAYQRLCAEKAKSLGPNVLGPNYLDDVKRFYSNAYDAYLKEKKINFASTNVDKDLMKISRNDLTQMEDLALSSQKPENLAQVVKIEKAKWEVIKEEGRKANRGGQNSIADKVTDQARYNEFSDLHNTIHNKTLSAYQRQIAYAKMKAMVEAFSDQHFQEYELHMTFTDPVPGK